MKYSILLFCLFFSCSSWMPSLSTFPDAFVYESDYGLSLVIQEAPQKMWSSASIWIKAPEEFQDTGLGHLLEHLLIQKKRNQYREILLEGKSNSQFVVFQCHYLAKDSQKAYRALLEMLCHNQEWSEEEIQKAFRVLQYERLHNPKASLPQEENLAWRIREFQKKFFQPQNAMLCVAHPEKNVQEISRIWKEISIGFSRKQVLNKGMPFFKALALSPVYWKPADLHWDKDFLLFSCQDRKWAGVAALFSKQGSPALASYFHQRDFTVWQDKNQSLAYRIVSPEYFSMLDNRPPSKILKTKSINPRKKLWLKLCDTLASSHPVRPLIALAMDADRHDLENHAKRIFAQGNATEISFPEEYEIDSHLAYSMAGTKVSGVRSKEYFFCHAMAVFLSQQMVSYFVDTGQAYEAVAWYDSAREILCIWVAGDLDKKGRIESDLRNLLRKASQIPINLEQWESLADRTRLYYLKSRDFQPENFPDIVLELSSLRESQVETEKRWKKFQNADFVCSYEGFIEWKSAILQEKNWLFLE